MGAGGGGSSASPALLGNFIFLQNSTDPKLPDPPYLIPPVMSDFDDFKYAMIPFISWNIDLRQI